MRLNTLLLIFLSLNIIPCRGQNKVTAESINNLLFTENPGHTVASIGKNIDCIFQDRKDNYWFASNGEGIYRYNGKTLQQYTSRDGLCSDYVWTIQEDPKENLWFTTRDGICSFDGKQFTDHTNDIQNAPFRTLTYTKGGLFFNHKNGMCFYDGSSFINFKVYPATYTPPANDGYRAYAVYCTLADRSGRIWFGTQEKGVCLYDGKSFSFIDGKNLDGPAVRSIYQSKAGTLWFGNNGGGFYRYNGKTLTNITEDKRLGNPDFLKLKKPADKPGTLARVFAMNEDENGNIWIGTADAGIWKYDGSNLKNYSVKDGLAGNSITAIYKDKKGKIWFVSNGNTIYQIEGQRFSKLVF